MRVARAFEEAGRIREAKECYRRAGSWPDVERVNAKLAKKPPDAQPANAVMPPSFEKIPPSFGKKQRKEACLRVAKAFEEAGKIREAKEYYRRAGNWLDVRRMNAKMVEMQCDSQRTKTRGKKKKKKR